MNNIEKIYSEPNIKAFADGYFKYISGLLHNLNLGKISDFMQALDEAYARDNAIFVAGNGGSASTASHIGNDLGLAVNKVSEEKPYRVVPIADNVATMTAIANDYGYEDIFTRQLNVQYKQGDVLLVISASGNSPNVVAAAEWVRERGGKVLGLLGFDGGKLKGLCDVSIVVETPKGEYGPVEDAHLAINHMLTHWIMMRFRKQEQYDFQF